MHETEPNNDFLAANKTAVDSVIEGRLETNDDRDFYMLDIQRSFVLDLELLPVKGLNHAVRVWKDDRTILKYIDDARKSSPERMCNLYVNSGTYFIEVMHGDRDTLPETSDNNYELHIRSRNWDNEEFENNDSWLDANLLEPEADIRGYFSPAFNKLNALTAFREEDWFYIDIELNDMNPRLLDVSITGVPDVNSSIEIMDAERNRIASIDNGSRGEGESIEAIGIQKSGRYFIKISSNFESNNAVPYILYSRVKDYDFSTEIEPNDTFDNANAVEQNEISARIFPPGDRDYFVYIPHESNFSFETDFEASSNPETGKLINKLEVESDSADLYVKIFDKDKRNEIYFIDNIKGAGKEVFPNIFLYNGFFIEISGKAGEPGSEYRLNITSFPFNDDCEKEPNDTKETATRIKTGRITGFISKKNDKDFYLLEYRTRLKKKFILQGIENSEIKISVTDALGFTIKSAVARNNESVSFSEMIDMKGYLVIESGSENYEEAYNILIED